MAKYFTSTSVHLATLALKDELIAFLRTELSEARADRLRAEEARDAAVSKAIEILTPKPAEASTPEVRTPREPLPIPETLDLSMVDPTDNAAITTIARSEMPSGKINASFLVQKIESVRAQVYLAHAAKAERAKEVGTIQEIPDDIAAMIDGAITKGKEQARTH